MRIFAYRAFSTSAAAALLVGCATSVAPQSLPASAAASPAKHAGTTSWLYVADDPFSIGIVYVFSYPDPNRRPARAIKQIGYAYGPCAGPSGDVWVPARSNSNLVVFKFAGGGTKPIGRLDLPSGTGAGGCAVDPVTGDLAVAGTHSVNVFAKAKGKAKNYALGSTYVMACAYDGDGNLFVDGMKPMGSSLEVFALDELPKGGKTFSSITLDKRVGFAGGLEWDGRYVAVATGGNGLEPVIYRFTVSGTKGTVVQAVHLDGLNYQAWFAVSQSEVVGTSGLYGPRIRLWPYPSGGEWVWEIRFSEPRGMAISSVP